MAAKRRRRSTLKVPSTHVALSSLNLTTTTAPISSPAWQQVSRQLSRQVSRPLSRLTESARARQTSSLGDSTSSLAHFCCLCSGARPGSLRASRRRLHKRLRGEKKIAQQVAAPSGKLSRCFSSIQRIEGKSCRASARSLANDANERDEFGELATAKGNCGPACFRPVLDYTHKLGTCFFSLARSSPLCVCALECERRKLPQRRQVHLPVAVVGVAASNIVCALALPDAREGLSRAAGGGTTTASRLEAPLAHIYAYDFVFV